MDEQKNLTHKKTKSYIAESINICYHVYISIPYPYVNIQKNIINR